jgi:hypothetical protein
MYQFAKFEVYNAKGSRNIEWLIYVPWPFNLKNNSDHLLFRMYQCTMFEKQRAFKILSGQYIPMSSLSFDLRLIDLKINRGYWFFRMYQCIKFDVHQVKRSQDIEWPVYSYIQFDPWHFDLKFNRVYLFFWIYQCSKFEVCQKNGSQDMERTVYSLFQMFIDLWPINLKIIRGLTLFITNRYMNKSAYQISFQYVQSLQRKWTETANY